MRIRINSVKVCDYLERVTLIDEELLAFATEIHLLRVLRHQRVKECVEPFVVTAFGTQNPAWKPAIK